MSGDVAGGEAETRGVDAKRDEEVHEMTVVELGLVAIEAATAAPREDEVLANVGLPVKSELVQVRPAPLPRVPPYLRQVRQANLLQIKERTRRR